MVMPLIWYRLKALPINLSKKAIEQLLYLLEKLFKISWLYFITLWKYHCILYFFNGFNTKVTVTIS